MGVPDPARSRAVIIGVHDYESLPKLPSVATTVNDLARLLSDSDLWGLRRPHHCKVLLNPQSPEEVLDVIHEAATEAEDAFVVYFAGHGLVSASGDLYLALPQSHAGRLYGAVAYEEVRRLLVEECTAPSKVVILDCCYSGRALVGHMGGTIEVATQAMVEGTYLMTSSAETKLSWAPEGEKYTAFTGELLEALDKGIPDGPDVLEMQTLFWHVRAALTAKSLPVPQQRARNAGHSIALVRNRYGTLAPEQADTSPPDQSQAAIGTAYADAHSKDLEWVDVMDIQEGREDRRILLSTLLEAGDGTEAVVLRSDRRRKQPGCVRLGVPPLLFAVIEGYFVFTVFNLWTSMLALPLFWAFLGFVWAPLTSGFPPNAVRVSTDGLYIDRFSNWIHLPWSTVDSVSLTGTRAKLRLKQHVQMNLNPRAKSLMTSDFLLCPVDRSGFDGSCLFEALRCYAPEDVLPPALRSPD
ncbi:caspase family protein [Streptomyces sp. NPDC001937]